MAEHPGPLTENKAAAVLGYLNRLESYCGDDDYLRQIVWIQRLDLDIRQSGRYTELARWYPIGEYN